MNDHNQKDNFECFKRTLEIKGKKRIVHMRSYSYASLDDKTAKEIELLCCSRWNKDRIFQGKEDLRMNKQYRYRLMLDIKSALEGSGYGKVFYLYLVLLGKSYLANSVKRLLCSHIDGKSDIENHWKLRFGISTSVALLGLVSSPPLQVAKYFKLIETQVYVDDWVIYSNSKVALLIYVQLLKCWLAIFGFKINKDKSTKIIDKNRTKYLGGRLGLEFVSKKGDVTSRLRQKTLKKYYKRMRDIICKAKTMGRAQERLYLALYHEKNENERSFPLLVTFPSSIWTCKTQQKKFFIAVSKLLKKKFGTKKKCLDLFKELHEYHFIFKASDIH